MINEKLEQLYASKWGALSTALNQRGKLDYAHPMLLRIEPEKLEQADLRVVIFGQETKGWVTNDGVTSDFRRALDRYYEWFCDRNGCKGFNKKKKGGVRGFFKGFKFFEKEITRIYPDKKIYFVWNNISGDVPQVTCGRI
jgi:hypothetical protein